MSGFQTGGPGETPTFSVQVKVQRAGRVPGDHPQVQVRYRYRHGRCQTVRQ